MKIVRATAEVIIPSVPNFFQCEDGDTLPIEAVEESGLKISSRRKRT